MTPQHSPAPWLRGALDRSPARVTDATGETIALVYLTALDTRKRDEAHAGNLALILAAPAMAEALGRAAAQFDFYAEQHSAKRTPDADAKAQTNRDMAEACRAALAHAGPSIAPDTKETAA